MYTCFGKLKEPLVIPDTVKVIEAWAFWNRDMKEVCFPQGLETIKDCAFAYCSKLQHVTIPDSVTTMGASVFIACNKLASLIYINPKVKFESQGSDAYDLMESLKVLVLPVYTNPYEINIYDRAKISYLVLPEGISAINNLCDNGFCHTDSIISVYLPKSLHSMKYEHLPYGATMYVIEGSYAHKFVEQAGRVFKLVNPIKRIELSEENLELRVKKGATLKATIHPKDATAKKVQWFSSDDKIATVQDGKVKAVGEGECDIYCRGLDCGLVTAKCHVVVTK